MMVLKITLTSSAGRLAYVFMSDGCTKENWIEIQAPEGSIVQVVSGTQAWTHLVTAHPGMAACNKRCTYRTGRYRGSRFLFH